MSADAVIKEAVPSKAVRIRPLPRRLRNILSLNDFEAAAKRYLPHSVFVFVQSGVEAEITLRDNREAFNDYHLVPRVLVGVDKRSQKTSVLGEPYDSPFGVAPMGMESLVGYRGDLEIAKACAANNIPFIQSGASLIRLEDIRAACDTAWFQAYLPLEFANMRALIERVRNAGFKTLVITVDMTAGSNRENTRRAGFSAPFRPDFRTLWGGVTHPRWAIGNFMRTIVEHGMPHFENIDGGRGAPIVSRNAIRDTSGRAGHTWEFLMRIRAEWKGKLVLKGLLDPRDVKIAIACGVDGIIVSTHGGRQIDGVLPAIHALPGCVEAAGDVPVMIDSGIRRGTDIIKCLALGAKFVFVGRPFNYAAAMGGQVGVDHAIGLLRSEFSRDIGNMGINRVEEITRDHIVERWR
ncbi:MAG TPA: alpha-hydroxy acid oxidase [Arsenicitalea sp.]|jgi:L-lactate dehydrogenase (cytochrome)|nr:alpha-hydroxy acid oxidase [Arsenicitalea sp.]